MWWQLIRLTLARRDRRQQQSLINRLAQADGRLNTSAQLGSNDWISDKTIEANPSTMGCQSDIDDAVSVAHCGNPIVENERGVRSIGNRNYRPFLGERVGVVCHDGSFRYWEWSEKKNCCSV